MKKREFIQLLHEYRKGTATSEERKFIESYYNLFEGERIEPWIDDGEKEQLKTDMLVEVWRKIQQEESADDKNRMRGLVLLTVKIAAAVIIIVATSVMIQVFRSQKSDDGKLTEKTVEQGFENDIPPGGNKAVLTLANGTQIVLDSAQNGALIKQGSTKIIKLNSGQLAYKTSPRSSKGSDPKIEYNTITTPRGGQYQVILPDGSKVRLNALSSLHFPTIFLGNERKVEVKGEAYFEVAKEPKKPFIVEVDNAKIEVLGTHFNVSAYGDEKTIKTTLAEGVVRVSKGKVSRVLRPGEQAGLDKKTGNIAVRRVNLEEVLAWEKGLFYFSNTNIRIIMREVTRWYDVEVVYSAKEIDNKDFSGVVSRYNDVHALLKRLELTGTVHFKVEGRKIIVMD